MEKRLEAAGRRTYSLVTMWRSIVSPRRVASRRQTDRRYPIIDRVEMPVALLAVALMILSILDSVFTLTLIANGGQELNPVMDAMLQKSVSLFTSTKMALTAIPAIILVATANVLLLGKIRARSFLAAAVGMYAGLIGYELMLLNQMMKVTQGQWI